MIALTALERLRGCSRASGTAGYGAGEPVKRSPLGGQTREAASGARVPVSGRPAVRGVPGSCQVPGDVVGRLLGGALAAASVSCQRSDRAARAMPPKSSSRPRAGSLMSVPAERAAGDGPSTLTRANASVERSTRQRSPRSSLSRPAPPKIRRRHRLPRPRRGGDLGGPGPAACAMTHLPLWPTDHRARDARCPAPRRARARRSPT